MPSGTGSTAGSVPGMVEVSVVLVPSCQAPSRVSSASGLAAAATRQVPSASGAGNASVDGFSARITLLRTSVTRLSVTWVQVAAWPAEGSRTRVPCSPRTNTMPWS